MNPVINTQSALMPTKQFIDQNGKPVDRHNFYNGQPRKGSSPEKILLGKRSVKTNVFGHVFERCVCVCVVCFLSSPKYFNQNLK